MILIFKREEISKVVVNKPYEVRFDFLVVLLLYFNVGLLMHFLQGISCQLYNILTKFKTHGLVTRKCSSHGFVVGFATEV